MLPVSLSASPMNLTESWSEAIHAAKVVGFRFYLNRNGGYVALLQAMKVGPKDLLHMDNTVQMHKTVPPKPQFRSLVVKHGHWRQRTYIPLEPGEQAAQGAAAAVATPPKVLTNGSSRKRLRVESTKLKVEPNTRQKLENGAPTR